MNHRVATGLLLLAAVGTIVVACLFPARSGHPVTPFMSTSAREVGGKVVTSLTLERDRPAVVVFVLLGCPCSEDYEPYVKQLHEAFGQKAAFCEVIAGDQQDADGWTKQQQPRYAVIPDPSEKIAREFEAQRSAYTALVVHGRIEKLWPGYSAEMLRELGSHLAKETGMKEHPLDLANAPTRMSSGCILAQ